MFPVTTAIEGGLAAYVLIGGQSIGYLLLRSGWPTIRRLETETKIGWGIISGAGFALCTLAVAGAGALAFPSQVTFAEMLFIAPVCTIVSGTALFSLRRKYMGKRKITVSVPKRVIAANMVMKKTMEKIPEDDYIKNVLLEGMATKAEPATATSNEEGIKIETFESLSSAPEIPAIGNESAPEEIAENLKRKISTTRFSGKAAAQATKKSDAAKAQAQKLSQQSQKQQATEAKHGPQINAPSSQQALADAARAEPKPKPGSLFGWLLPKRSETKAPIEDRGKTARREYLPMVQKMAAEKDLQPAQFQKKVAKETPTDKMKLEEIVSEAAKQAAPQAMQTKEKPGVSVMKARQGEKETELFSKKLEEAKSVAKPAPAEPVAAAGPQSQIAKPAGQAAAKPKQGFWAGIFGAPAKKQGTEPSNARQKPGIAPHTQENNSPQARHADKEYVAATAPAKTPLDGNAVKNAAIQTQPIKESPGKMATTPSPGFAKVPAAEKAGKPPARVPQKGTMPKAQAAEFYDSMAGIEVSPQSVGRLREMKKAIYMQAGAVNSDAKQPAEISPLKSLGAELAPDEGMGKDSKKVDSIINEIEKKKAEESRPIQTRDEIEEEINDSKRFILESLREKLGTKGQAQKRPAGPAQKVMPKSAMILKRILQESVVPNA